MADFKFPSPLFLGRRSVTNDLGLGTILGNASPVSPRWDYLRQQHAGDDGNARRSGAAPNVEPPPGTAEFREAEATLAAFEGAQLQPKPASAAVGALGIADMAESQLGARLAAMMARAAPAALAAAPPIAAALPLVAFPTFNSVGQPLPLGDRFRARQAPGEAAILERRITDGLLGTGVGAKWEVVPSIQSTLRTGSFGLRTVVVDADQLRNTLGANAAKQLFATGLVIDRRADEFDAANRTRITAGGQEDLPPPPLSIPSKIEMRIWASTDKGLTTTSQEATREQVEQVCPNFPEYEGYAMDAAAKYKAAGFPNGMEYGRLVHREVESRLKMDDIQSRLKERGVRELRPELAIRQGFSPSYTKGSSRIDVVELHRDHVTVCVYELKTGDATIPLDVVKRYSREVGIYAKSKAGGYENIYFIPIRVP